MTNHITTPAVPEDDYTMGDVFNAYRAHRQEKRRSNLHWSTNQLVASGIEFEALNGGVHLVLRTHTEVIDFWPSTGLWWIRGTRNKRRGIVKLIKYVSGKQRAIRAIASPVP